MPKALCVSFCNLFHALLPRIIWCSRHKKEYTHIFAVLLHAMLKSGVALWCREPEPKLALMFTCNKCGKVCSPLILPSYCLAACTDAFLPLLQIVSTYSRALNHITTSLN